MKGLGTIVNVVAVVVAALLGVLFKNGIREKYKDMLMGVLGISTMFIGISGTLGEMFTVQDGVISTQGTMLLVVSLVIGGLLGEFLDIERGLENVGEWIKNKIRAQNDNKFVDGFVNSTMVICVGAMAIMGSLQDGLTGEHETLFVKSTLDFFVILIFSSAMGIGTLFSAVPLGLYQGGITLASGAITPYMSEALISNLGLVGNAMIFGIGINFTFGKKIKVGNLLPGLLVPIAYEFIQKLF